MRRDAKYRRYVESKHAVFAILLLGYLLFILYPILRADRYCNDDLIRSLLGNYGWNNNGRHLANLLMRVLQFGSQRAVDISPLPQLIAIAILAWTGVLIARRYALGPPLLAALVTFPLGAQPFYLENLSYKFDAPCMALAMLFALLPFLVLRQGRKAWILSVLALLACLNLYQPAINVFLIFAILEIFLGQVVRVEFKAQTVRLSSRVSQAVIASVTYQLLFGPSLKDWMREHGTLIHSASQLDRVLANAGDFWGYAVGAFDLRWIELFSPLAILAIVVPVFASLALAWSGRTERAGWQTGVLLVGAVLLPCVAVFCVAGPMLLLEQPILMPRVMVGVGALLCAGLIAAHAVVEQKRLSHRPLCVIAGIWALGFAVIAGAYGNAAAAQKGYESRIAANLADDVASMQATRLVRNYLLVGSAGFAPVTEHAAKQFPLFSTLISSYLKADDFNSRNFLQHYISGLKDMSGGIGKKHEKEILAQACSASPRIVRAGYTLRLVSDTVVVDFLQSPGLACDAPSQSGSAPVPDVKTP